MSAAITRTTSATDCAGLIRRTRGLTRQRARVAVTTLGPISLTQGHLRLVRAMLPTAERVTKRTTVPTVADTNTGTLPAVITASTEAERAGCTVMAPSTRRTLPTGRHRRCCGTLSVSVQRVGERDAALCCAHGKARLTETRDGHAVVLTDTTDWITQAHTLTPRTRVTWTAEARSRPPDPIVTDAKGATRRARSAAGAVVSRSAICAIIRRAKPARLTRTCRGVQRAPDTRSLPATNATGVGDASVGGGQEYTFGAPLRAVRPSPLLHTRRTVWRRKAVHTRTQP